MFKILKNCKVLIVLVVIFFSAGNKSIKNKEEILKDSDGRPNIVWIVADDLGVDLGCYGNKLVYTPNLDKLASQGTRYTGMYTVAAVCSVSRSAMITGMYPVSIGCEQHRKQYKDSLPKSVKPIIEYFKKAGYFVTNKGKTDYNFIHTKEDLYNGTKWEDRKTGQPFFSQIQISLPHRPFLKDSLHPINADEIILPPYYPDEPLARKDWAMYLETIQIMDERVGEILKQLDREGLSENTVVFFFGDQGRPMVRAKQFLYDSGINTPLIIRWPGKIKSGTVSRRLINNLDLAPTTLKTAGINIPDYIQGVDFLEQNNTTARKYVYAMRDRRDETVDRIRMIRSENFKYIKNFYTDRPYTQFNAYKKNFYPVLTLMQVMYKNGELNQDQARFFSDYRPQEEFYDLSKDPHELNNLANSEEYKIQKAGLKNKLNSWLKNTDLGTYPEDSLEISNAEKLMQNIFKKNMEVKGLSPDISDEEYLKYWEKLLLD